MTSTFARLAVTPAYNRQVAGQIWFLHGAFDTGLGTQTWLRQILNRSFNFYDYEVLFPTAAQDSSKDHRTWYHQPRLTPEFPEDELSIMKNVESLSKSISDRASAAGLPLSKVVVGGFSQGGSMALHLAYRVFAQQLAGCFALSTFLPPDSRIFKTLHDLQPQPSSQELFVHPASKHASTPFTIPTFPASILPPTTDQINLDFEHLKSSLNNKEGSNISPKLFMAHGIKDPVVRYDWARSTFVQLKDHGVEGALYAAPRGEHSIDNQTLRALHIWIQKTLSSFNRDTSGDDDALKPMYGYRDDTLSNPSDFRN